MTRFLPAIGVFVVLYFVIRWLDRYTERYDSGNSARAFSGSGTLGLGPKDSTGYAYRRQTAGHHADTQRRAQEAIAAQETQRSVPSAEPRTTTERTGG